jgi:hypothetical protein
MEILLLSRTLLAKRDPLGMTTGSSNRRRNAFIGNFDGMAGSRPVKL